LIDPSIDTFANYPPWLDKTVKRKAWNVKNIGRVGRLMDISINIVEMSCAELS